MRMPQKATYLLRTEHPIYPVVKVHFNERLVTLQDGKNSFNTVNIKNVEFDFTNFTQNEINEFIGSFRPWEDMCRNEVDE